MKITNRKELQSITFELETMKDRITNCIEITNDEILTDNDIYDQLRNVQNNIEQILL